MEPDFQKVFSIPAIEGFKLLLHYLSDNQGLEACEAIELIKAVELDADALDFDTAEYLLATLDVPFTGCAATFYQTCIKQIILVRQPKWGKLMMLGRSRFSKRLKRDEQTVFRQAGLLNSPPEDDVIIWWDELCAEVRMQGDLDKLAQARQAEKLTITFEAGRLKKIGITTKPEWTAIEDNTAGYDVRSFEQGEYGLDNKLIEVKSTIASPLRFYVTRNEWEQAEKYGAAYFFYIWDMKQEPPRLYIRTVDQVKIHIPQDNEKGKWKSVEIPLGAN